jgi:hypothetical protein
MNTFTVRCDCSAYDCIPSFQSHALFIENGSLDALLRYVGTGDSRDLRQRPPAVLTRMQCRHVERSRIVNVSNSSA